MDILILAMLALVTGALVYLFSEQRHFKRVDHTELIRQDDEDRRTALRIERLEDLLGRLVNEERRKREETASALSEVRAAAFKLRQELDELRTASLPSVAQLAASTAPASAIPAPAAVQMEQPATLRSRPVQNDAEEMYVPAVQRGSESIKPRSLPQDGRTAEANNLFEQGLDQQSVARQLGLSSHAVELINSLRGLKTA